MRHPQPIATEAPDLLARLDALAARVEEARAAAQVIADGDASAMGELDAEVDAMAEDVAALKAISGGGPAGA